MIGVSRPWLIRKFGFDSRPMIVEALARGVGSNKIADYLFFTIKGVSKED